MEIQQNNKPDQSIKRPPGWLSCCYAKDSMKEEFIKELIFTGNIVQDSDDSIPQPERGNRFNRYIELLNSFQGNEGLEVAQAVIKSMQAKNDYGAYQTTLRTLGKFPSSIFIQAMINELPTLIQKNPDWAGELLSGLANSIGKKSQDNINQFNLSLSQAEDDIKSTITNYIKQQEKDGWLKHRVGILKSINA